MTAVDNDCDTTAPITVSGSALLVPVTTPPFTKVPLTVSSLITISITVVLPSWNNNTFSTIAVASLILVSPGSFA